MKEEDYYTTARQNLDMMRKKVALSKKADGKELVEGLPEINLSELSKSFPKVKPSRELGA